LGKLKLGRYRGEGRGVGKKQCQNCRIAKEHGKIAGIWKNKDLARRFYADCRRSKKMGNFLTNKGHPFIFADASPQGKDMETKRRGKQMGNCGED